MGWTARKNLRRCRRFAQPARDHDALNLTRAFVNSRDPRVSGQSLDPTLIDVTAAPVYLHRAIPRSVRRFAGIQLRLRRRVLIIPTRIANPRRLKRQRPRRLQLHRCIRNHELNRLKIADRPTELSPLF